jgi:hypothetical protein
MNIIPLLGVIFYNWSVFALIYAYWLETLAITFCKAVMIMMSQGDTEKAPHIRKAIRYFVFNAGILIFYLLFIVVFIGFVVAEKQEGHTFVSYLLFIDKSFRYTLITLFGVKLLEMISGFFMSGLYKKSKSARFYTFFDIRFIMIHFVIILGFFAFNFLNKKAGSGLGIIAFAVIFVVIKSITDVISVYLFKEVKQESNDISMIQ